MQSQMKRPAADVLVDPKSASATPSPISAGSPQRARSRARSPERPSKKRHKETSDQIVPAERPGSRREATPKATAAQTPQPDAIVHGSESSNGDAKKALETHLPPSRQLAAVKLGTAKRQDLVIAGREAPQKIAELKNQLQAERTRAQEERERHQAELEDRDSEQRRLQERITELEVECNHREERRMLHKEQKQMMADQLTDSNQSILNSLANLQGSVDKVLAKLQ